MHRHSVKTIVRSICYFKTCKLFVGLKSILLNVIIFTEIDDNFIFGQVFIFFLGGYESPGNALACALYQIAKNPKIQETLITEIRDVLQAHGGEASFEALQSMKYLRQVLSGNSRHLLLCML